MLKVYSLKHNLGIRKFLYDYLEILNAIISDIWETVTWHEWQIPKKKQKRLFPHYQKDKAFRKEERDKHLKSWNYAAHWVDSAEKTAYSIMESWRKNYKKGKRKRVCPRVRRPFARVKQTLMKVDSERLRITLKPHEFVYLDLSKRYFKLNGRIGEPILTPTHIHLPVEADGRESCEHEIGWDCNKNTLDGFCPTLGWIRADLTPIFVIHSTYDAKKRRINRLASKKLRTGKRLKQKYSRRERDRVKLAIHHLTNAISRIGSRHGFEDLEKSGMYRRKKRGKRSRRWNRELGYTDWKKIINFTAYKSVIDLFDPYHTSKDCSRCGCENKDLKGEKFECDRCRLRIDRQMNAAVNIYKRMEGLPHDIGWFDENVMGGFTQTGAEWKATDELARLLYDTMKPQFYLSQLMTTWNRTQYRNNYRLKSSIFSKVS